MPKISIIYPVHKKCDRNDYKDNRAWMGKVKYLVKQLLPLRDYDVEDEAKILLLSDIINIRFAYVYFGGNRHLTIAFFLEKTHALTNQVRAYISQHLAVDLRQPVMPTYAAFCTPSNVAQHIFLRRACHQTKQAY
uniref:Uncharacterized protein n=1 Tax=Megaselia scalaris TaxID=36166 RepID=T1H1J9_MEGSC